ncbi:MAG: hypothetical protein H7125_04720, partial [Proteobacteria bacterium]|nr:hypothetical protein [Burkholderiales bacterium]
MTIKPKFRLAPIAAALSLVYATGGQAAPATWATDISSSWHTGANWGGAVPANGDDVTIFRGVPVTVTYNSGTTSLVSLFLGSSTQTLAIAAGTLNTTTLNNLGTVTMTGGTFGVGSGNSGVMNLNGGNVALTGTLTLTGAVRLQSGTITGGTVQQSGANALVFTNSSGVLDGVTLRGTMNIGDAANTAGRVRISNGLTVLTEGGGSPGVINVGIAAGATGAALGFTGTQNFD